jgi:hypothetical protein
MKAVGAVKTVDNFRVPFTLYMRYVSPPPTPIMFGETFTPETWAAAVKERINADAVDRTGQLNDGSVYARVALNGVFQIQTGVSALLSACPCTWPNEQCLAGTP